MCLCGFPTAYKGGRSSVLDVKLALYPTTHHIDRNTPLKNVHNSSKETWLLN